MLPYVHDVHARMVADDAAHHLHESRTGPTLRARRAAIVVAVRTVAAILAMQMQPVSPLVHCALLWLRDGWNSTDRAVTAIRMALI